MNWQTIATDFEADGSLRDIRIDGTSMTDWQRVWALGILEDVSLTFSIDGAETEPPLTIEEVFTLSQSHAVIASYCVERITYNAHFFEEGDVEFDVDPREIKEAEGFARLSRFMKMLADATRKPVRLTHENLPRAVIALLDPSEAKARWLHRPQCPTRVVLPHPPSCGKPTLCGPSCSGASRRAARLRRFALRP